MKKSACGLHPSFRITRESEGYWYWNRWRDIQRDTGTNVKAVFCFDDPALLADTPLLVKIGPNRLRARPYNFVGVVYARDCDRKALEDYARRFPWAELIIGLNRNAGTLPNSKYVMLKK